MRPEWVHFAGVQESGPEQEEVGKVAEANPQAVNGGHSLCKSKGQPHLCVVVRVFFLLNFGLFFVQEHFFFPPVTKSHFPGTPSSF